ncbi:hypothetical protein BaRGS_00029136 [Batillaria attramentaria]|uniref:CUB domain-containing protein n=1 Tax=Batillaria attramentaria TaxID=370345 RepID=A0ABD0JWW8_9CAEN
MQEHYTKRALNSRCLFLGASFDFPTVNGSVVSVPENTSITLPFQLIDDGCAQSDFKIVISKQDTKTRLFGDFCDILHVHGTCVQPFQETSCGCLEEDGMYQFHKLADRSDSTTWVWMTSNDIAAERSVNFHVTCPPEFEEANYNTTTFVNQTVELHFELRAHTTEMTQRKLIHAASNSSVNFDDQQNIPEDFGKQTTTILSFDDNDDDSDENFVTHPLPAESKQGENIGYIIGGVIGSFLFTGAVIVAVIILKKKREAAMRDRASKYQYPIGNADRILMRPVSTLAVRDPSYNGMASHGCHVVRDLFTHQVDFIAGQNEADDQTHV